MRVYECALIKALSIRAALDESFFFFFFPPALVLSDSRRRFTPFLVLRERRDIAQRVSPQKKQ